MAENNKTGKWPENSKRSKGNFSKDHIIHKRKPDKPQTGDSVIYVSTKSSLKALQQRVNQLINNNENEIVIYCMGAAIQRAILLVLEVCESHPTFQFHTNTLTTELTDDLEPAADDADYEIQRRYNSALRIRVFRTNPLL